MKKSDVPAEQNSAYTSDFFFWSANIQHVVFFITFATYYIIHTAIYMMKNDRFTETLNLHTDYSARFGNHLLRTLIDLEDENRNIAISPARLQAVMVMLANWASPAIQEKILKRVGNDSISQNEVNMLSGKNLLEVTPNDWCKNKKEEFVPTIELQTILWIQKELIVNKEALAMLADDFALALKPVDFTAELKNTIDKTIDEATHGLIKHLNLKITPETLAVITDILYFKGTWRYTFEKYYTYEQSFYGTEGKRKVAMMKRTGRMLYADTPQCQMVQLPYTCMSKERRGFSMRIYLPKPRQSVQDVLRELLDNEFECRTKEQEVRLSLPRFSVESSINMHKLFEELDLFCVFETKDIIPKCIKDLQIEQIVQQVKVSVDENGTEAAAVTSIEEEAGCCLFNIEPELVVMTVNRPFIFEIAENASNTILFAGVINNIE